MAGTEVPGNETARAAVLAIVLTAVAPAQVDWRAEVGSAPAPRADAAAVHDWTRGEVLLFGGRDDQGAVLGDTWVWDGATWSLRAPAGATPPPRRGHALAWDQADRHVVLFGGMDGTGQALDDTWEWDGQSWAQRNLSTRPVGRQAHSMASDPLGGVLLFGGASGTGASLGDTWRLDANGWARLVPAASPGSRFGHAMALDAARQRVVMFGGRVGDTDTWEWDGVVWMRRAVPGAPSDRSRHGLAFDHTRERIVLYGGATATAYASGETWEWDGAGWSLLLPVNSPPSRLDVAFAFGPRAERCLLFGGLDAIGALGDAWTFGTAFPAHADVFGVGCSGAFGPPVLDALAGDRPWLGESISLTLGSLAPSAIPVVSLGGSRTIASGIPLPIALDALGMPGCSLRVSQDATALASNIGGVASLSFGLPAAASLAGLQVHLQGAAYELGANALGVVVSNGLTLTLGVR